MGASGKTALVEIIREWGEANGFTMLTGQNLDTSCTFTVPLLCWEEIFTQMTAIAMEDHVWKEKMDHVICSNKKRMTAAFGAHALAPELSNLLCAMFDSVD